MLNYLIITAAVIIALVIIASAFWGDFPVLDYNNKILQIVCRTAFVVANVLLLIAAFMHPCSTEGYTGNTLMYFGGVILTIIIYALCEFLYYLCVAVALSILLIICEYILRVIGWIIYDDKERFIFHDD